MVLVGTACKVKDYRGMLLPRIHSSVDMLCGVSTWWVRGCSGSLNTFESVVLVLPYLELRRFRVLGVRLQGSLLRTSYGNCEHERAWSYSLFAQFICCLTVGRNKRRS